MLKKLIRFFIVLCGIIAVASLTSCRTKKEFISEKEVHQELTRTDDTTIINHRIIQPDIVQFNNEIDLNRLDIFKQMYNATNPFVTVDEESGSIITSYIDSDNKLKQNIKAKPKPIPVSDTTKKSVKETKIETHKESKEKIVVEPPQLTFWQKIKNTFNTIKTTIFIIAIIGVFVYLNKNFNLISKLKNLF